MKIGNKIIRKMQVQVVFIIFEIDFIIEYIDTLEERSDDFDE